MIKNISFLIFSLVLIYSNTLFAACEYVYDWQSGNNYMVCDNFNSTTIYGNNFSTGSTWNQTQNSNGSYYGTDSNGNFYTGDNNSGHYYNFGTGKTCFGTGVFRTCN